MIKLLLGHPGIGKTKEMIKSVNDSIKDTNGNIIFIGESNECALELNHDIRYINISEYPINSSNEFIGYLYGLMGTNYDVEKIYLDGILNVYIMTPKEICDWLDRIKLISEKHKVYFEISISITGDTPECFAPYL